MVIRPAMRRMARSTSRRVVSLYIFYKYSTNATIGRATTATLTTRRGRARHQEGQEGGGEGCGGRSCCRCRRRRCRQGGARAGGTHRVAGGWGKGLRLKGGAWAAGSSRRKGKEGSTLGVGSTRVATYLPAWHVLGRPGAVATRFLPTLVLQHSSAHTALPAPRSPSCPACPTTWWQPAWPMARHVPPCPPRHHPPAPFSPSSTPSRPSPAAPSTATARG